MGALEEAGGEGVGEYGGDCDGGGRAGGDWCGVVVAVGDEGAGDSGAVWVDGSGVRVAEEDSVEEAPRAISSSST